MVRRKNGTAGTAVLEDVMRCGMCGATVHVGPDGRCGLGHRVVFLGDSSFLPFEAEPAATGPAVPPAPVAADTPPPPAAAPEARPSSDDPFFHPYDEVLAEGGAAAPAAQAPSAMPGLAPDELEDLLSWSDDLT